MNQEAININVDDEQNEALEVCQDKYIKVNDIEKTCFP